MIFPNGLFESGIVSASFTVGLPKLAWFQMLKKSVVKRKEFFSVSLKFLINEKSQFCWRGPRKTFLPRLPKSVVQKVALFTGSQIVGESSDAVAKAYTFR